MLRNHFGSASSEEIDSTIIISVTLGYFISIYFKKSGWTKPVIHYRYNLYMSGCNGNAVTFIISQD